MADPNLRFLLAHPAHFIALGAGTGLSPKAPGTVGTLLAFPIAWASMSLPPLIAWVCVCIGFLFGIWCCERTGRALGVADHGGMVWDEVVAMWAVLLLTPARWPWWVAAFLLFRLFDIWKPFPIRWFDRNVKGGFGVMLDDLLAAVYAGAVLLLAHHFLKGYGE
jgi:phosphatidylglycerophosphatase A